MGVDPRFSSTSVLVEKSTRVGEWLVVVTLVSGGSMLGWCIQYRWRLVVMVLVISGLGLGVRGEYWWMHLVVFWRMVVVFVD